MKTMLSLTAALLLFSPVAAQPQRGQTNPIEQIEQLCIYGVDYSIVNVYAAEESDDDFFEAFRRINLLLISEPEKYNFERAFRTPVGTLDIGPTQQNNENCRDRYLHVTTKVFPAQEEIMSLVRTYRLPQQEGVGVVLVGLLLDKSREEGTYDVVFFDIATRDILSVRTVTGKAGGFGLRNYWARTLFNILRSWRR